MAGEIARTPGSPRPPAPTAAPGPALPATGRVESPDAADPLASAGDAPATAAADLGRGWLGAADRRMVVALLVVIAVSVGLRLLTWNEIADGAHARYVKTALFGGFAAVAVWFLIRIQTSPLSRLPLVCAVLVLLSGDAIHYTRLANPITRGGPVLTFAPTLADEAAARRGFDFETGGPGRVHFEPGAAVLESPPNGTAYMIGRLGAIPDVHVNWWLPVGLAERDRDERLTWRASINRTGGFYVVTEMRQLLIQVVGYGIHITYPDERKQAKGFEIAHPVGSDGQIHQWELSRNSRQISLSLDGKQVWSAPSVEAFDQVKLGETKVDPQHGGTMRVEAVSYIATLDR